MKGELQKERIRLQEEAKDFEKSPFVFFTRKNKLTYLIIVFLLIFGVASIRTLPKELNPEVEIPIALVITAYPGASPLDVESQITDKIETEVSELSGVKKLTSTSSTGISTVTVEFEAGEDLDNSIRKLKDKVDEVTDLPDDASTPAVVEISLSDQPIFVAAVSGEKYDIVELKKYAENLKDNLEGIAYVSEVRVIGGREKEIKVNIDSKKLADYGLSLSQTIAKISASNLDVPIGSMEIDSSHYLVRMNSQFKTAAEIGAIQVAQSGGKPVYLADVASVAEDLSDISSVSQISVAGNEPSEAVSIQMYKRTGGDITALAEEARRRVEAGRGRDYPSDAEVIITLDLSEYITESIDTLMSNGIQTVVLILILLWLFLGYKEALIAGLAVPFSFFVAFIAMSAFGVSLNFLSLFSLVLALGLLVDSAIVMVEGMYEKVARYGLSGFEAAILTIREYAAPLLSGMLTTVAAFLPLLFVIGIFGQFMKTIPIVVISTLAAALFVSLTIIPAVGLSFMNPVKEKSAGGGRETFKKSIFQKICRQIKLFCQSKPRQKRIATRIFDWAADKYYVFLPKVIGSKRERRRLISGVWVLLLVSFAVPITGFLKVQSFVPSDAEYFFINLEMPNGTVLERTAETVGEIENILRSEKQIINFVTSIGSSSSFSSGFSGAGVDSSNRANIQANLTPKENRQENSTEIVSRIRQKLQLEITEGTLSILEEEGGPPSGEAVEVRVQGEDIQILADLAEKVKDELVVIPTVIDAKTSTKESAGEFVFYPNRDIMAQHGFSPAQVGSELRNAVNRDLEEEIKIEGDEIKINVGIDKNKLRNIQALEDIEIMSPNGKTLFLSELGRIEIQPALSEIAHFNEKRTVSVTAGTDGGNPTEIANKLKEQIAKFDLPDGYLIEFGGESQELQEVFMDMFMKMIIGIILILFILVIQFNSYRQVLIILFTIPLAMIGVIWGMAISRLVVDIPAFIGVVSLTGIVVNNAIILIDEINRELRSGKYVVEAVRDAGRMRLRPIFLTTITTIFGLLPLSITQPDWRNMGFTIIFGLTFATFLTLVIVPTFYVSLYGGQLKKENL